ncbi:MAG: phosphoribosyltransferase family protein [Vagococcus sp.]|uniref:ComF family protein n=1 Tax=Vagococcus sp. TaxID=1933889 RepID=UPI002FC8DFB5
MRCRFCQTDYSESLQLNDIFSFKRLVRNNCCCDCYAELNFIDFKTEIVCQYCRKVLVKNESCCQDCQIWEETLADFKLNHRYLCEHNEKMSELFKNYKFLGDIRMRDVLAKEIYEQLKPFENKGFIIVPIPLAENRLHHRGFNQVETFLENSNILYDRLLIKRKNVKSQSEKSREDRLSMKQPFKVPKKMRKKIKGEKLLIVDDVYTTGRTILHAYDCLNVYHPREICSFSLSR